MDEKKADTRDSEWSYWLKVFDTVPKILDALADLHQAHSTWLEGLYTLDGGEFCVAENDLAQITYDRDLAVLQHLLRHYVPNRRRIDLPERMQEGVDVIRFQKPTWVELVWSDGDAHFLELPCGLIMCLDEAGGEEPSDSSVIAFMTYHFMHAFFHPQPDPNYDYRHWIIWSYYHKDVATWSTDYDLPDIHGNLLTREQKEVFRKLTEKLQPQMNWMLMRETEKSGDALTIGDRTFHTLAEYEEVYGRPEGLQECENGVWAIKLPRLDDEACHKVLDQQRDVAQLG